MCYSDLPYLYTGRGLAELSWPFTDDPQVRARYEVMEYPVGISYWACGTAWATHWLSGSPDLEPRYASTRGRAVRPARRPARDRAVRRRQRGRASRPLALLSAWFLAGVHPRRPWDAAAFALSPALALTGLVNWDLLAVALVAGALWAWARDRPVLTGVLIGLGTATKLYPLFLLGALLVICVRRRRLPGFVARARRGRHRLAARQPPAYLTGPEQWKVLLDASTPTAAPTSARSGWLIAQAGDVDLAVDTINTGRRGCSSRRGALGVLVLGLRRADHAAAGPARLPGRGGLPAGQQGLLAAVRAVAAAARRRWPGRAGATSSSGRRARSSTSRRCGGTSAATSPPPAATTPASTGWRSWCGWPAELYLVGVVVRDILRPAHDPVRGLAIGASRDCCHGVRRDPASSSAQLIATRSNAVAV